jgi:hypothetical protein
MSDPHTLGGIDLDAAGYAVWDAAVVQGGIDLQLDSQRIARRHCRISSRRATACAFALRATVDI